MSKSQILVAGHGGQGVLELGNYMAYYGLLEGKHVAYTPSYGPETRGGKVKCYVVISDEEIDSPIVEEPDYLVVMNIPSMDFQYQLRRGGILLMNSSLIDESPKRTDITTFRIPATQLADELKRSIPREVAESAPDTRIAANCVMFGVYLFLSAQEMQMGILEQVFKHFLIGRKSSFIPVNTEALKRGYEYAKNLSVQRIVAQATL